MKKEIHPENPIGRLPDEAVDRQPDQLTNQSVGQAETELQLAVLSELPGTFTTAEGVAIAAKCGMSERSFKRFIKDRKGVLFVHSAHGNYSKL